jgi:adenylate kinase family enzyme
VRILVTGASGSGTTTLGKALAADLGISFLDTDEFFWIPTDPPFKQKRDGNQRRILLRERLASCRAIVVAGSVMEWDAQSEDSFDLIVFLQAPAEVRVARLRARELAQFGRVDEEFIAWAAQYDEGRMDGRSLPRHLAWLESRRCPIIRLSSTRPVAEMMSSIRQQLPDGQEEHFHGPVPVA